MFRRYYNLILMGFWLVIAAGMFAPELVLPENVRRHLVGPGSTLVGVLALVLAAYNFVRWWALRSLLQTRSTATVNPLSVRKYEPDAVEKYEPNPELDFLKIPDPDRPHPPPGPSANGDH